MKIKNYLYFSAIIIVLISSCKKEDSTTIQSIIIGDNYNIMAYSGDVNLKLTTLGTPMNSFALDMDNNGLNDIKFVVENYGNANSTNQRINIIPLGESVYISYQIIDEPYCKYTNSTGDTVWFETYDSTRTYDSIVYIQNAHDIRQRIYSYGERIGIDDASHNEEMQIAYLFQQYNSSENYDYKYNEWIGLKNKYIGVKIIKNNATFLGWIQVEVIDYDKIHIGAYYLKQIR